MLEFLLTILAAFGLAIVVLGVLFGTIIVVLWLDSLLCNWLLGGDQ